MGAPTLAQWIISDNVVGRSTPVTLVEQGMNGVINPIKSWPEQFLNASNGVSRVPAHPGKDVSVLQSDLSESILGQRELNKSSTHQTHGISLRNPVLRKRSRT